MATPIRMKSKLMNKIHLDASGSMVIDVVQAASDAASKGVSAQPETSETALETQGLPGGASVTEAAATDEQGTGAPLERVAPELLPVQLATNQGSFEAAPALLEDEAEKAQDEEAPVPAGLGDGEPAAPLLVEAKDPNAQKETTVAPDLTSGKLVGQTETSKF